MPPLTTWRLICREKRLRLDTFALTGCNEQVVLMDRASWKALGLFVMLIEKRKVVVAFSLMLAFAGQSPVIATASCFMMDSAPGSAMPGGMGHSMHAMPKDAIADDAADGCCGEEACDAANCLTSLSAFVDTGQQSHEALVGILIASPAIACPAAAPSSLFRPPISC